MSRITQEEIGDLCGMLEERRPAGIDITIKDQLTSSINLGYYPPREALRKALLANEEVFLRLIGEFIEEIIIDSIRQLFSKSMTAAADKKAALALSWCGRNFVIFTASKNVEN